MFLGIITSDGKVGLTIWIPAGIKINATAPLDYAIWDKIASVAWRETVPDIGTMKEKVNTTWQELEPDFVRRVCQGLRPHLEALVGAKGGHIE